MCDSSPEGLLPGVIHNSERDYETLTLHLLAQASHALCIFDADLSRGGYHSAACYEALRGFLSRNATNRLTMVVHNTDFLTTYCPLLVDLLTVHGHHVLVYLTTPAAYHARDAFMLVDNRQYLQRFHIDQARFKYACTDAERVSQLSERFAQLVDASNPAVFAKPLGL